MVRHYSILKDNHKGYGVSASSLACGAGKDSSLDMEGVVFAVIRDGECWEETYYTEGEEDDFYESFPPKDMSPTDPRTAKDVSVADRLADCGQIAWNVTRNFARETLLFTEDRNEAVELAKKTEKSELWVLMNDKWNMEEVK
jgi:hypothetical protein